MGARVLPVLFLVTLVSCASASYVALTTDGYENIVIKVDDDAVKSGTSCQSVMETIRTAMNETSAALRQSLDKKPFFGNMTVIVPDSWRDGPCNSSLNGTVTWARAHKADIRITADHPVFVDQPHTFQYGPCGHPALPVQLPWSFLTLNNITSQQDLNLTPRGKRLVKEWAHYRYGIFDEGGVPSDPLFPSNFKLFETSGSITSLANQCVGNATIGKWNKDSCPDPNDPECEFTDDVDNPNVETSLMYRPDLSHMSRFCTKETHEMAMPNKQNYYCAAKSTTEVIYQHSDFSTPYTVPTEKELDIQFVTNPFTGYHVIIDAGSVNHDQFEVTKAAVAHFIQLLPDGLILSVDSFNDIKNTLLAPVPLNITKKNSVQRTIDALVKRSDSVNGVIAALQEGRVRAAAGQDIILLTNVTNPTNLDNLGDTYRREKVNVHLLYFRGDKQSTAVSKLTEFGSVHHIPTSIDDGNVSRLTWAIDALQNIYSRTHIQRESVFERTVLNAAGSVNGTFIVDGSMSKLLVAIYDINKDKIFPSAGYPVITDDQGANHLFAPTPVQNIYLAEVSIDSTQKNSKTWSYSLVLGAGEIANLRISAWAEAADSSSVVRLNTWTSTDGSPNLDPSNQPLAIFAHLSLGRKPINGAAVSAKVFSPDRTGVFRLMQNVILDDHGPADVTSGDGIYSGFLTNLSTVTTIYSIRYEVDDNNGASSIDSGVYERSPTAGSRIPMSSAVAAPQFKRYAYGPSIELTYLPSSNGDTIPPARVTDLAVKDLNPDTRVLTLNFTATLDDYGVGESVLRYQVTQLTDTSEGTGFDVRANENATEVSFEMVLPQDGEAGTFIKYRVWAIDPNNNKAPPSNIVAVRIPLNTGLAAWAWGLIGGGIALLVILLIILLFCFCCPEKCNRVKRKTKSTQDWVKAKTKSSKKEDTSARIESKVRPEDWRSPDSEVEVEIRQKSAANQGYQDNFRASTTYFGQDDFDHISAGHEGQEEREMNEMIKRAPSMDLQTATILIQNSSNLTIDKVGLVDENRKVYAKPNKPSAPPPSFAYANHQTGLVSKSQSDTHLHYADSHRPGQRSSLSQSHSSIYVDHKAPAGTFVNPAISSLASTLRAGLEPGARGEGWQDSNSFIYTDPRFDDQPKSTFEPASQPYNTNGLPPPIVSRSYAMAATTRATPPISEEEEVVGYDHGTRPRSLISAV